MSDPERVIERGATIHSVVEYLIGEQWTEEVDRRLLMWPPDVFAIAATLLRDSGAYLSLAHWPILKPGPVETSSWQGEMRTIGREWLLAVGQSLKEWPTAEKLRQKSADVIAQFFSRQPEATASLTAPPRVMGYWQCLREHGACSLFELERESCVAGEKPLTKALVGLIAAADEASFGLGAIPHPVVPDINAEQIRFQYAIAGKLASDLDTLPSTLCININRHAAIVLPKTRTPQTGMTIRALTHNLALLRGGEVRANWVFVESESQETWREKDALTLLLVPWPPQVFPNQFRRVATTDHSLYSRSSPLGFFKYSLDSEMKIQDAYLKDLFIEAHRHVGPIDGVVFPELSISEEDVEPLSEKMLHQVKDRQHDLPAARFVIAGVAGKGADGFATNKIVFKHRIAPLEGGDIESLQRDQHKHHRWHLNSSQIRQYGLGAELHPKRLWVEHIQLRSRAVEFINLDNQLLMCMLVCEDLAQTDPIGDALRAVGPNLLICLLADGPQLASRWPSRYATTLADDPGCSVLTLTSQGMTRLSQPRPGDRSRRDVIALWKEAGDVAREIVLEPKCGAIALSLSIQMEQQLTADGRDDRRSTRCATLSGIRQIPMPSPRR